MVRDLIYANTSRQALDLRCSNSLHVGPWTASTGRNFGFFCTGDAPKPATAPHRLTERQESSTSTCVNWHLSWFGCLYPVLPRNERPDSKRFSARWLSHRFLLPQNNDMWWTKRQQRAARSHLSTQPQSLPRTHQEKLPPPRTHTHFFAKECLKKTKRELVPLVSLMPLHPKELYAKRIQQKALALGGSWLPNSLVYTNIAEKVVQQPICTKHKHKTDP